LPKCEIILKKKKGECRDFQPSEVSKYKNRNKNKIGLVYVVFIVEPNI
jgi:hypothetical protein